MKWLVVVCAVASAFAQADGDADTFIGAYDLDKRACGELVEAGYKSAYIKVGKDPLKYEEISIQFYGDDARQDSILLGKGERTPLGVSRDRADEVKEKWVTKFPSDTHVSSVKTTTGPSFEYTEKASLKISGVSVIYSLEETQHERKMTCKLNPKLKKEEKASACEQIRVNLNDRAPSQTECLKGTFKVISNDSGQVGVEYKHRKLKLTCDLGFDKPMGQFAPAVESCEFSN